MSYNATLDKFLMFYSQSEAGNGLTRGLETELSKRTYVPTKLDKELTDAINYYRLVILTGNAGDGKTAFIQKVEEMAESLGSVVHRNNHIGSEFVLHGKKFLTLYDGSMESVGNTNQEMLQQFFAEFSGDTAPTTSTCLIVAMNEGKLRDFLSNTAGFRWLSTTVLDHLQKGAVLPDDVALVNLNLRSVVDASFSQTACLFDQVLDRYVANEFWEACEGCAARIRCPVKFNIDTFRIRTTTGLTDKDLKAVEVQNKAASKARTRLKTVFQVLHFRKRIHMTVRDLRSVLAFTLFGKKTCAEIDAEIQAGNVNFTPRYYYNALFDSQEKDRILSLIREFDMGLASSPHIDSRLSFSTPKTYDFQRLFECFEDTRYPAKGRQRIDELDLLALHKKRPQSPEERNPEALAASQLYVTSLRRKLYFEGDLTAFDMHDKPFLVDLLPYDNLAAFMAYIETGTDPGEQLKKAIVLAISRSESIFDATRGEENICIRTRQDSDSKVKAFFTYSSDQFTLDLPKSGNQGQYVEFLPSSIILKHIERPIELEISLDLYEMLMRIRDGYVPAAGEMRTFFLNLLMFKKQLMATPSEQMLLTKDDYQLFKMTRTPTNSIKLSLA
ncbi:MAG: hypothetical protein AB7U43_00710 [Desulfobacter sp.]